MGITATGRNKAADALTPTTMFIHNGDPGASGTDNVISTGQSCTFGAAANGVRALTNTPEFAVDAGDTVTHVSVRDSASDVIVVDPLDAPETYANAGTHRVTAGSIQINAPA